MPGIQFEPQCSGYQALLLALINREPGYEARYKMYYSIGVGKGGCKGCSSNHSFLDFIKIYENDIDLRSCLNHHLSKLPDMINTASS